MKILVDKTTKKLIAFNYSDVFDDNLYELIIVNIDFLSHKNIDLCYYDVHTNSIVCDDLLETKKYVDSYWVDDIEKLKDIKADELYWACEEEMKNNNAGLISSVINKKIDCREIDILRNDQLIKLIELSGNTDITIEYICYDNSKVNITFQQLKQIFAELGTNVMNMLYHKHNLYVMLNSETCDTREKINDIKWVWPIQ